MIRWLMFTALSMAATQVVDGTAPGQGAGAGLDGVDANGDDFEDLLVIGHNVIQVWAPAVDGFGNVAWESVAFWRPVCATSAAMGDFDGDGLSDLAVGCADTGEVLVWLDVLGAAQSLPPLELGDECGYAMATCDILEGPGDDLVVGCPGYDSDRGRARLFSTEGAFVESDSAATGRKEGDRFASTVECLATRGPGQRGSWILGSPHADAPPVAPGEPEFVDAGIVAFLHVQSAP